MLLGQWMAFKPKKIYHCKSFVKWLNGTSIDRYHFVKRTSSAVFEWDMIRWMQFSMLSEIKWCDLIQALISFISTDSCFCWSRRKSTVNTFRRTLQSWATTSERRSRHTTMRSRRRRETLFIWRTLWRWCTSSATRRLRASRKGVIQLKNLSRWQTRLVIL